MKGRIVIARGKVRRFNVPVSVYLSGRAFVADCPMLGLASHGKNEREARRSIANVIEAFLEASIEMGTLDEVLGERGWTKQPARAGLSPSSTWMPPRVLSAYATSHASA